MLRRLDQWPPESRRRWAVRGFIWSFPLWVICHVGLVIMPRAFFEHVLLWVSVLAIQLTLVTWVQETDTRKELG